jgi:hypothetical protein
MALARDTPPNTTVAVVGAGNILFFDHGKSVDLLLYNDHFVATRTPHRWVSTPSHEKWDLAYSVGKLRRDEVVGLFDPTAKGLRELTQWGYRKAPFYFGNALLPRRVVPSDPRDRTSTCQRDVSLPSDLAPLSPLFALRP